MKRRVRKIANFFAFNLLFFALYLNFIHKDQSPAVNGSAAIQEQPAPFSTNMASENALGKSQTVAAEQASTVSVTNTAPLRLSIN